MAKKSSKESSSKRTLRSVRREPEGAEDNETRSETRAGRATEKKSTKESTKESGKKSAKKSAKKSTKKTTKKAAKKTVENTKKKAPAKAPKATSADEASSRRKASRDASGVEKTAQKKSEKKGTKTGGNKEGEAAPAAAPAAAAESRRGSGAPTRTDRQTGRRRHGQLEAERSRFDLAGDHERVLAEKLGTLPPGYGLTIVRAWIRDPRNIVVVWDVNDPEMVARAGEAGWDRLVIRVLLPAGDVLAELPVGRRSGTYHHPLDRSGATLRLALGIRRPDGFFEALAVSGPVRVPPESPVSSDNGYVTMAIPLDLDRSVLTRSEPPPRQGHRTTSRHAPATRLAGRIELASRGVRFEGITPAARSALERPPLAAPDEDSALFSDLEDGRGAAPDARAERQAEAGEERSDEGGRPATDEDLSSGGLARRGAPSSHSLGSPGGHRFGR
jgi:hypothetical protein